jgi:hypothetical protein
VVEREPPHVETEGGDPFALGHDVADTERDVVQTLSASSQVLGVGRAIRPRRDELDRRRALHLEPRPVAVERLIRREHLERPRQQRAVAPERGVEVSDEDADVVEGNVRVRHVQHPFIRFLNLQGATRLSVSAGYLRTFAAY